MLRRIPTRFTCWFQGHACWLTQALPACCLSQGNKIGATPLYAACYDAYLDAAHLLIDRGAIIDAATEAGETALYAACQNGHAKVRALRMAGFGDRALLASSQRGREDAALFCGMSEWAAQRWACGMWCWRTERPGRGMEVCLS